MLEGTLNGTDTGPRGSPNPNPISKSPSQPAGKTSGNMATHSDRRPKPSLWMPWQTLGARVAWQDHSSWPAHRSRPHPCKPHHALGQWRRLHLHQEERVPQEDYRLPATQPARHQAHTVSLPPSSCRSHAYKEFDAWNGYHSVALAESDRHYTTFITPWGRYRYRSAPQGYIASGDTYTARYDSLVSEVNNKTKSIDDALLWSTSIKDTFHQATEWLDICARNGITLNPRRGGVCWVPDYQHRSQAMQPTSTCEP